MSDLTDVIPSDLAIFVDGGGQGGEVPSFVIVPQMHEDHSGRNLVRFKPYRPKIVISWSRAKFGNRTSISLSCFPTTRMDTCVKFLLWIDTKALNGDFSCIRTVICTGSNSRTRPKLTANTIKTTNAEKISFRFMDPIVDENRKAFKEGNKKLPYHYVQVRSLSTRHPPAVAFR